jgi:hypothetical protein
MALDPADPIDQQIRETRELFDHLDDRYMALVASFQMLKPLMADDPLVERLRSAGKYPGASIVAKGSLTPASWTVTRSSKTVVKLTRPSAR